MFPSTPTRHRAHGTGHVFACEVALFRVARLLLDELTALERVQHVA